MKKTSLIGLFLIIALFNQSNQASDVPVVDVTQYMATKLIVDQKQDDDSVVRVEFPINELCYVADKLVEAKRNEVNKSIDAIATPNYTAHFASTKEKTDILINCFKEAGAKHYCVDASLLDFFEGGITSYDDFFASLNQALSFTPEVSQKSKTAFSASDDFKRLFNEWLEAILPPLLPTPTRVEDWVKLAEYIKSKENQQKDSSQGAENWWVKVGGRLLLLRNKPAAGEGKAFYISDHGTPQEVFEGFQQSLLSFSVDEKPDIPLSFWNWYDALNDHQKETIKKEFIAKITQTHGDINYTEELYRLSFSFENRDICGANIWGEVGRRENNVIVELNASPEEYDKDIESMFQLTLEQVRVKALQVKTLYTKVITPERSSSLCRLEKLFHEDDLKMYKMLRTFELISKELGAGKESALFRPVTSFGRRNDGEPYRVFAEEIDKYFDPKNCDQNNQHIASEMRDLLMGKETSSDERFSWVPNLTANWFISETKRNKRTMLYSLVLLDLLQANIPLWDSNNRNLHSWKYALVHPEKPPLASPGEAKKVVRTKDMYGKIADLERSFDGVHPMTHGGSSDQGKTDFDGTKPIHLNPVQQKEGHLLAQWLSVALPKAELTMSMSCHIDNSNAVPPKGEESYKEIEKLYNKGNQGEPKDLDEKQGQKRKILLTIINLLQQRLGTLDRVLTPSDENTLKSSQFDS